jgi:hypothetical protein
MTLKAISPEKRALEMLGTSGFSLPVESTRLSDSRRGSLSRATQGNIGKARHSIGRRGALPVQQPNRVNHAPDDSGTGLSNVNDGENAYRSGSALPQNGEHLGGKCTGKAYKSSHLDTRGSKSEVRVHTSKNVAKGTAMKRPELCAT